VKSLILWHRAAPLAVAGMEKSSSIRSHQRHALDDFQDFAETIFIQNRLVLIRFQSLSAA
jgi:hypothetical protein